MPGFAPQPLSCFPWLLSVTTLTALAWGSPSSAQVLVAEAEQMGGPGIEACSKKLNAAVSGLIRNLSLSVNGVDRTFDAYLPSQLPATPVPLVFLVHGHGGSADTLTGHSGDKAPFKVWMNLAEQDKMVLVFPDGTVGPDGKSGWNDGRADSITNPTVDDIAFFEAMVQEAHLRLNIDHDQIFAAGVSNGGAMVLRMAQELSHHIDGVAAVIMGMPAINEASAPPLAVNVLFMNGTSDPLVPWNGGDVHKPGAGRGTVLSAKDSALWWVNHNQCDPSPTVTNHPNRELFDGSTVRSHLYDGGTDGTRVALYQVMGGGHAEPSRAQRYSWVVELVLGRQNHDIEAATVIWDFFQGN